MRYFNLIFSILFFLISNLSYATGQPVLWLDRNLTENENTALQNFHDTFKSNYALSELKSTMMSSSSDAYEMEVFKYRSEQLKYIGEQSSNESWKDDFKDNLENWAEYNYIRLILAYPIERAKVTGDQKIKPLPGIYTENAFENVPLQNEAALKAPVYKQVVDYYTTYMTAESNSFNDFSSADAKLNQAFAVCNKYFKGQVQAYAMAQQLIAIGPDVETQILNAQYKIFSKQNNDKELDKSVLEACEEKMNEKPSKAKKSKKNKSKSTKNEKKEQPFTLTGIDGKEVYLSDFQGKVVYVDFWASWCGPCRRQFPHAKELKHSFSDKELKNIVFLYISSDNTEKAWKNAIEKFEIEGTHVWSPNNIPTSAGRHYDVYSIPRYMLIDKNGEVVDYNAKRPSMPGIKEDILNLLAK